MSRDSAATQDPYKALYGPLSVTPNAGIFLKYEPFNTMGRSPVVGPGGTRDDRQIMHEAVARYMRNVTGTRPHDGIALSTIALDYLTGYASDPFNAVVNGKLTPLFKGNPRRNITARNHYYGVGEATTPEDQAWYSQSGRISEWTAGLNPLRVKVPYSGAVANRPYFGGFEVDQSHAHQFPHWGSLLFQTPEFAMFGVNFSDQIRLYDNQILSSGWGPFNYALRSGAWAFAHATLLWKTGSSNSPRLYSRAEIMDWVVYDFEKFYDQWYAATPGFLNPPTNVMVNGNIDDNLLCLAGASRFGPCNASDGGLVTSEFQLGYWLSALHMAHKLGFIDALKAASPKVAAVVNWLFVVHRRHITGRINDALEINPDGSDYQVRYWSSAQVTAANGDVSLLPQNHAQVLAAQGANKADSWDTYRVGTTTYPRDGQALDATLAGAAILLDCGLSGQDLETAAATSESLFQQKLASETAMGYETAGNTWFKYHQTTNNRPYKP